jgi:hypothetical protein
MPDEQKRSDGEHDQATGDQRQKAARRPNCATVTAAQPPGSACAVMLVRCGLLAQTLNQIVGRAQRRKLAAQLVDQLFVSQHFRPPMIRRAM